MRKILEKKLIEENPSFTQEELDWGRVLKVWML
jgi:hypothetical protein